MSNLIPVEFSCKHHAQGEDCRSAACAISTTDRRSKSRHHLSHLTQIEWASYVLKHALEEQHWLRRMEQEATSELDKLKNGLGITAPFWTLGGKHVDECWITEPEELLTAIVVAGQLALGKAPYALRPRASRFSVVPEKGSIFDRAAFLHGLSLYGDTGALDHAVANFNCYVQGARLVVNNASS